MSLSHILGIIIGIGILWAIVYYLVPAPMKWVGWLVLAVIAVFLLVFPLLGIHIGTLG